MKVVLISPLPPPCGGIAGWTERMQKMQLKNDWQVKVVDSKVIGGRHVFGEKGKRNVFIEIKRSFGIWKGLLNQLRDRDARVVQTCIPATAYAMMREMVCAIITKARGRKFIVHYRCTLPNMVKGSISLCIFRMLTGLADCAFVLNMSSEHFAKRYSKTTVITIPNFIEAECIASKKNIREKIKTILYVGGVIEEKGCADIIRVAEKLPEYEFQMIGALSADITHMPMPKNVKLFGERSKSEVYEALHNADVFIFLSRFNGEGFSNALAEAMACGLPCIVTDWAANKDMIGQEGGVVVPIHDVDAAINALRFLEDKQVRSIMSIRNISWVDAHYNDRVVTDQYVDFYEKLTDRN